MSPIERAISMVGLTELANRLGTKPQVIVHWRKRKVPPRWCAEVERATEGKVTRKQLRPDIFDGRAA